MRCRRRARARCCAVSCGILSEVFGCACTCLWVKPHVDAWGGGRVSPRQASSFLTRARKEPKNTPHCLRPFGQPASRGLRGAPPNSLRATCEHAALRSNKRRRVSLRSVCTLRCSRHPASLVPQAQTQGGENGSVRLLRLIPFLAAPAAPGSGCGQRCRRTALLRDLACARLFERSAARRAASWGAPQTESGDAGLPVAKRRDADNGAHFFGYFLAVRQESTSPAGASPGLCPSSKRAAHICRCKSEQTRLRKNS